MTENESEAVILHEVGEARADRMLGPDWKAMIGSFTHRHPELLARSIRDNMADSTLPGLIEREAWCSLHYYMAEFDGLRLVLFPSLTQAYESWRHSGRMDNLIRTIETGKTHWAEQASKLLDIYRENPEMAQARIQALRKTESNPFIL